MYERLADGQMRCLVHRGSESEDFVSANQPDFFRLFDVVDFENHVTGFFKQQKTTSAQITRTLFYFEYSCDQPKGN